MTITLETVSVKVEPFKDVFRSRLISIMKRENELQFYTFNNASMHISEGVETLVLLLRDG